MNLIDVEIWKPVEGFSDYEVSDHGRVKSYKRRPSILLNAGTTQAGFTEVSLYINGRSFTKAVHRLVLEAFISLCPDGWRSKHKDGNRKNNCLGNLRWKSPWEK